MPLRAFPFPINIGTDICSVKRIFGLLKSKSRNRFATKLLTPLELQLKWDPVKDRWTRWSDLQDDRDSLGRGRKPDYVDIHKGRRRGNAKSKSEAASLEDFEDCKSAAFAQGPSDELPVERANSNQQVSSVDGVALDDAPLSKAMRTGKAIDEEMDTLYRAMWRIAESLAGRFAAKEAAMKAYQSRRLTYQDIQILSPPYKDGRSQAPIAMVRPEDGDWDNAQIIPMSISHDGVYATAVCMAYEKSTGATFESAEDVMRAIGAMDEEKILEPSSLAHPKSRTEQVQDEDSPALPRSASELEATLHQLILGEQEEDKGLARNLAFLSPTKRPEKLSSAKYNPNDDGNTIWVGSIHPTASEQNLLDAFKGLSSDIKVALVPQAVDGARIDSFAWVTLASRDDALRAFASMNGREFLGYKLKCTLMVSQSMYTEQT